MNNKFIESQINAYSTAAIRLVGTQLFKQSRVSFIEKQEGEKFIFNVESKTDDTFTVAIENPYSPRIETTCTCMEDAFGKICEHQVAALLYIKDEELAQSLEVNTVKKTKRKDGFRFSSQDLAVKNFNPITDEFIQALNPKAVGNSFDYNYSFKNYSQDHLTYEVADAERDYSAQKSYNVVKITSKNSKTIGVKCTCSKLVNEKELCEHAVALFEYLKATPEYNFIEYLGKKGNELLNKKAAKQKSVTLDVLKEFFDVYIEDAEIKIVKKHGHEGLIFDSEWEESIGELLMESIDNSSSVEKLVPALTSKKDYDFTIAVQLNNWDDINICPVTAKKNKNNSALISAFKVYDSSEDEAFPFEYSKTYPELFRLLEIFKSNYDLMMKKHINNNDLFIMLKRTFELAKELKYPAYYYCKKHFTKTTKKDLKLVIFSEQRAKIKFKVHKEKLLYVLNAYIQIGDDEIIVTRDNLCEYYLNRFVIVRDDVLYLFKNLKHQKILESFREFIHVMVPHGDYTKLEKNFLRPLMENFEVDLSEVKEIKTLEEYQRPVSKEVYLKESEGRVLFVPKLTYKNGAQFDLLSDTLIATVKKSIVRINRDIEFEDNYINFLEGLHDDFLSQRDMGVYYLDIKQMTTNYWFLDAFEKMREHDIKIFGLNDLKAFKYSTHKANVATILRSDENWFDVNIKVSFGNYTLSISELRRLAQSNDRYVELGDGSIGVLPKKWLAKIQKMFRHSDATAKDDLKISKLKFSVIDDLFEDINQSEIIEELAEKRRRLLEFHEIASVDVPSEVNAELRGYQKEGFNWLNFLEDNKWGGILADDMGLGKTLQILAFLQAQINTDPNSTHLVVLPTTLVFNWEKEIKKFTKDIKTHFHTGVKRLKNSKKFENFNLIVTTYGVLLNDIDFIKDFKFKYAILDESQLIKNPSSKRYKAAILINAKNRIAMTGTPIENNTFDLYAQMNFVNPGFLGSQRDFREDYSLPIDRDRNELRAKDLHKLINPFILRRTKTQVATELPPKIEDVLYCEMEPEQLKVYEAYRNKYRDYLMGKIEEDGLNKSKMFVLEGLTKLRQICDSPRLLSGDEQYTDESIKIKTLVSHIEEKTNNHKILVFSQFVKMLSLVKKELDDKNISYEYLDGKCSAKQREESVENFQNNDGVRVFLISLKAGGTGLNLTAADYIYLLDPWWNPAVENQAIDRAYRIGQDKKVIAYRMIAKNSIEEKIMNIQSKKTKLASDIIQTDESILKELTQDDILDLFK